MNRRLELLQLRKEALVLRAELERMDLAQHVTQLRRPSELSYKGLQWLSLLRVPLAAAVAARFGAGGQGSLLSRLARYAGIAVACWKFYRGARKLFAPPQTRA